MDFKIISQEIQNKTCFSTLVHLEISYMTQMFPVLNMFSVRHERIPGLPVGILYSLCFRIRELVYPSDLQEGLNQKHPGKRPVYFKLCSAEPWGLSKDYKGRRTWREAPHSQLLPTDSAFIILYKSSKERLLTNAL